MDSHILYNKIEQLMMEAPVIPNSEDWEVFLDRDRSTGLMDLINEIVEQKFLGRDRIVGADLGAGFASILGLSIANAATNLGIPYIVYAVEKQRESFELIPYFAKSLGFGGVVPVHADALEWKPLESVDIVVAEMFETAGINEPGPQVIRRFKKNYPDCIAIPDEMRVYITPIDIYGVPVSAARQVWTTAFPGWETGFDIVAEFEFDGNPPETILVDTQLYAQNLELPRTNNFCSTHPINLKNAEYAQGHTMIRLAAEYGNRHIIAEVV